MDIIRTAIVNIALQCKVQTSWKLKIEKYIKSQWSSLT